MENLNADFATFMKSEQAKREPVDLGNWRERVAHDAERNGDAHADAHPDRSLPNRYADTSVEDNEAMPDLI